LDQKIFFPFLFFPFFFNCPFLCNIGFWPLEEIENDLNFFFVGMVKICITEEYCSSDEILLYAWKGILFLFFGYFPLIRYYQTSFLPLNLYQKIALMIDIIRSSFIFYAGLYCLSLIIHDYTFVKIKSLSTNHKIEIF